MHLCTADVTAVCQFYRATFDAPPRWRTVRLPFAAFRPHRIGVPLDTRRLRRIGMVAIGRLIAVDLCVGRVVLYRDEPGPDDTRAWKRRGV